MKWENITLEQYQALYRVLSSDLPDWEQEMAIVATLFNLTPMQLDELSLDEYLQLKKQVSFLHHPVPKVKRGKFQGKKYRYKIITDVRQMPFARYAEVKTFTGTSEKEFIENLHQLTASIVIPYRKKCGVWIRDTYDAKRHSEYAEDLLHAPFVQVHASAVFFYLLFAYSIMSLSDYMIGQMESQAIANPKETYIRLCETLDGFILQSNWPTLKESQLRRLGIFPPSTH